ncbi:hypothetical protein M1L60_28615 [Actinoplanes sp. TRM 88003]|uniref:Uncharacterized protein n=1 Tax=Paractinoplanes aksuensis TaxID=2939490 RepID=A0ABT1DUN0_9ACTN|nr:hypothetical protein [Actinoplanes aksuensis]MCO8274565.1 hypothetical protein [Actinoplanes aksuensis]
MNRHDIWQPTAPPPMRAPSGLFPGPSRPTYREPHPISAVPLLAGLGAGAAWLTLFGSLGRDLAGYAWWTVLAAVSAWAVALVLTAIGDRAVAVGVAVAGGFGLSIAMAFVGAQWITTQDWPLW